MTDKKLPHNIVETITEERTIRTEGPDKKPPPNLAGTAIITVTIATSPPRIMEAAMVPADTTHTLLAVKQPRVEAAA